MVGKLRSMTDPMDLTTLSNGERGLCADPPTAGDLCRIARSREGHPLKDLAVAVGVSHVTVLSWEKRSDPRLVAFWRELGYRFPEEVVETRVVSLGKDRTFRVGHPLVDCGVVAEWSGMKLRRRDHRGVALDEYQYAVDEQTGTYRFSALLHGLRTVIVSFQRKK